MADELKVRQSDPGACQSVRRCQAACLPRWLPVPNRLDKSSVAGTAALRIVPLSHWARIAGNAISARLRVSGGSAQTAAALSGAACPCTPWLLIPWCTCVHMPRNAGPAVSWSASGTFHSQALSGGQPPYLSSDLVSRFCRPRGMQHSRQATTRRPSATFQRPSSLTPPTMCSTATAPRPRYSSTLASASCAIWPVTCVLSPVHSVR